MKTKPSLYKRMLRESLGEILKKTSRIKPRKESDFRFEKKSCKSPLNGFNNLE